MKEIYCPLCKKKNNKMYCTAQDNQNKKEHKEQFTVVQCNDCHFLYLNPVPQKEVIATYYPEYYWVGEKKKLMERIFPFLFSASREKARYIKKYKAQGNLLDIGCAEGFFLKHMKEQGWDVTGIDFSTQAVLYGKNHFGLELYAGEVTELKKEIKKKFDVITLWATLEHIYDPVETLTCIHSMLKKDGLLIFAVPNMDSLQAKIFGKHWLHLDVPRHLCFFTPETVKLLCEKTGFSIKDISYQSREHNPGGWVYSFLYHMRDEKNNFFDKKRSMNTEIIKKSNGLDSRNEKPKMSVSKKIFYWSIDNILITLSIPLTYIEGMFKSGGTITVIAEKKVFKK